MVNQRNKGTVLLTTVILVSTILSFVLAGMVMVRTKVAEAEMVEENVRASTVAEAGIEHGIFWIREMMKIYGDFAVFDALDTDAVDDPVDHSTLIITTDGTGGRGIEGDLSDSDGNLIGEYDVYYDVQNRASTDSRDIVIRSVSYAPSKTDFQNGAQGSSTDEVFTQIRISQEEGKAGNFSYFINHWGWFYGSSITANGTIRANGKFTLRYDPTVNGSPIYNDSDGADLQDKINDGGIMAGLNIDGSCQGMGGLESNRYPYEDPIVMPNLSNLDLYKQKAINEAGSLTVAGVEFTGNGVFGDAESGKQNLYLVGTAADPIELNGTVVVEGDLIISGVVSGQGSIIAGGNVYIPDDIVYANAPTSKRPASDDEATVEQWRTDNKDKDMLGLYAQDHIIVGDMTNSTWQYYVYNWLNDSNNRGDEDCGLDRLHGTDDVGEDDGKWSVETYTSLHSTFGAIPSGSNVGDPIPGTGEDIDGDGLNDGTVSNWSAEFKTSTTITSANWGGTLPATGFSKPYRDIATSSIAQLNGCFYTNHAFAGYVYASGNIEVNGALISRNESVVYSASGLVFNHDERLTGGSWADLGLIGGGGQVWNNIQVIAWWKDDNDITWARLENE